jgi:cation transport ATPase
MRSFLGILAGFFTVPIVNLSCNYAFQTIHPAFNADAYFGGGAALIVLIYGTFSVLLGGYVTGIIARHRYVMNGLILGCLGLLFAGVYHFKHWNLSPVWFHIIALLLVVPVSVYGAHLAGKRHERKALATA